MCHASCTPPTWENYKWPSITHLFLIPLKIARIDGIYETIIIILELDFPTLLQDHWLALLRIFLGGSNLPIFLSVGTEFPQRRRIPIHRRIIRRVPNVLLKIIQIIDGFPLVTTFRYLGLYIGWPFSKGVQFLSGYSGLNKKRNIRGYIVIKTYGY